MSEKVCQAHTSTSVFWPTNDEQKRNETNLIFYRKFSWKYRSAKPNWQFSDISICITQENVSTVSKKRNRNRVHCVVCVKCLMTKFGLKRWNCRKVIEISERNLYIRKAHKNLYLPCEFQVKIREKISNRKFRVIDTFFPLLLLLPRAFDSTHLFVVHAARVFSLSVRSAKSSTLVSCAQAWTYRQPNGCTGLLVFDNNNNNDNRIFVITCKRRFALGTNKESDLWRNCSADQQWIKWNVEYLELWKIFLLSMCVMKWFRNALHSKRISWIAEAE